MVIVGIVILLIVLAVAGGGLASTLAGRTRSRGAAPLVLVAGAGVAVVLVVLVAGVGLLGRGRGHDHRQPPVSAPTTTATPPSVAAVAPAVQVPEPVSRRIVPLQAVRRGQPVRFETVGGLSADAVVHLVASGFRSLELAHIELCVAQPARASTCVGKFPAQMGDDGGGDFLYQIPASVAPGSCAYGAATCSLKLTGTSGRSAQTQLVIGESRRGHVDIAPRSDLRDGDRLTVAVSAFPAATRLSVVLCAPRGGYDARHCSAESSSLITDPTGAGRAELVVSSARLGTDGVPCGPRAPCGVVAITDSGFMAAPAAPLEFSLGPGATYDPLRLAAGLSAAALLALLAIWLVRRTDWTKPTEAATPEVDAADLETDKSLDDLFGTDAELEARDPIPF